MYKSIILTLLLLSGGIAIADDINLPQPQKTGGKPLFDVLAARKSIRSYSTREISLETLSSLLWAANGINRQDGKRTTPSTMNAQQIDVYVIMKTGSYLYDVQDNKLVLVTNDDLREFAGSQDFAKTAPLTIVLVADSNKLKRAGDDFIRYANADCGFISQNIYLFCASEGLGTVIRGSVNANVMAEKLKLPENKKVMFAQSVGYPSEEN